MRKEAEQRNNGEGARPSSLVAVHKLRTPDPLYDQQLQREVATINERTRKELGSALATSPTPTKRKPQAPHKVDVPRDDLVES